MAPVMAGVLAARGRSALVFRGDDGLDELTTTGPSRVWWVRDGAVTEHRLDPAELGVPTSSLDDLVGGDAAHNAQVVRDLLDGRTGAGARRRAAQRGGGAGRARGRHRARARAT